MKIEDYMIDYFYYFKDKKNNPLIISPDTYNPPELYDLLINSRDLQLFLSKIKEKLQLCTLHIDNPLDYETASNLVLNQIYNIYHQINEVTIKSNDYLVTKRVGLRLLENYMLRYGSNRPRLKPIPKSWIRNDLYLYEASKYYTAPKIDENFKSPEIIISNKMSPLKSTVTIIPLDDTISEKKEDYNLHSLLGLFVGYDFLKKPDDDLNYKKLIHNLSPKIISIGSLHNYYKEKGGFSLPKNFVSKDRVRLFLIKFKNNLNSYFQFKKDLELIDKFHPSNKISRPLYDFLLKYLESHFPVKFELFNLKNLNNLFNINNVNDSYRYSEVHYLSNILQSIIDKIE